MANDVHYVMVFAVFFIILGLIAPFLNDEFGSDYDENDASELEPDSGTSYGTTNVVQLVLNLLLLPFWTFGFPVWVNLWLFLPIRLTFIFVLARNIWIGGGG